MCQENEKDLDGKIEEAKKEAREAKKKVKELEIKKAKEEEKIVEDPENLQCEKHPGAEFVRISDFYENESGIKVFACEKCLEENRLFDHSEVAVCDVVENLVPSESFAYWCPHCEAYVYGLPRLDSYDSTEELAGSWGDKCVCRICQEELYRSQVGYSLD